MIFGMKIILVMAITADGIMAKDSHHLPDWTGRADKQAFVAETKKHGCIIMGKSTFETIGRPLPQRLNLILTSNPKAFQNQRKEGVLEFFSGSPKEVIDHLEQRGFSSAVLAGGAKTNTLFLSENLVDEILITVAPKLFGSGLTMAQGNFNISLKLLEIKKLDEDTIQLRYQVKK